MRPALTTASLRTGSRVSASSSARRHRRRHSLPVEALEDRRLLSVTNGSFEFGMVGWTIELPLDGFADAVTTHTSQPSGAVVYGPTHGQQFALLKTDGPGSYTTATQSVAVAAGDKVSGWAFFDTNDYSPFADNAQVYVRETDSSGAPGAVIATVFDESVQTVGDRAESPWRYWDYTFSSAGTYAIQARVTNTGDSAADSFIGLDAVNLNDAEFPPPPPNTPPVASAGGPYTINEGQNLSLAGSATDADHDALSYGWDLNGDGTFNDAFGAAPVVSWSQLVNLGIGDGPQTRTIRLQVGDGRGDAVTADAELTINNTPPQNVQISGPTGPILTTQTATFSGFANDPAGPLDPLTFTWSVTRNGLPFGADGTGASFVFSSSQTGSYVLTLSVSDGDPGGVSTATRSFSVVTNNPPTANAGGPYVTNEGSGITLVGIGSDPDGDAVTFAWDLDTNPSTFETPGRTPTLSATQLRNLGLGDGPTSRSIRLRVTDSKGAATISNPTTLTVNNVAPSNVQISGPSSRNIGEIAAFSASAFDPAGTLDPLVFTWTVSRQGTFLFNRTGSSFSFTPDQAGAYLIALGVSDGDGGTATASRSLTVINNKAPVANAGGPYSIAEGDSITLDGSASSDPDGDPLNYGWDLDNNGSVEFFGPVVTLPWSTISNYGLNDGPSTRTVTLRVTDNKNASATATASVNIANTPPGDLAIYGPTTLKVGQTGSYFGTATDPAGPFDPIGFSWGITRGGQQVFAANGQSIGFQPTEPGEYLITLYASDGDAVSTITVTVPVTPNEPPQLTDLSVEPVQVYEGEFVVVRGTYDDPDGLGSQTIEIDWGDGNFSFHTPGNPMQLVAAETNPDTNHTYFMLQTATWLEGEALARSMGGHLVTINDAAENAWVWNTFGSFGGYGAGVIWLGINDVEQEGHFVWTSGEQSSFTDWNASSSEPNNAGNEDYGSMWDNFGGRWNDFGPNGLFNAYALVEINQPFAEGIPPNQFAATGTYFDDSDFPDDEFTLAVTVVDDGGARDTELRTIRVLNSAPTADFPTTLNVDEGQPLYTTGTVNDLGINDFVSGTVDFGDGSLPEELPISSMFGTTQRFFNLFHDFGDNGTYTMTLSFADDDGGQSTHVVTVNVKNVAPSLSDLAVQPGTLDEGGSVLLTGQVHDAYFGDSHTVLVDWGDGQTSTVVLGQAADDSFLATHTYADDPSAAAPGGPTADSYAIVVTATDDDGGSWSNVSVPATAAYWDPAAGGNGHYYMVVFTGPGGIQSARDAAANVGGNLVTILSAEENQFLVDSFLVNGGATFPYWMGISDANEEGVWRWDSGELAYHRWKHYPVWQTDEWGNVLTDEWGNPIPGEYAGPTPTTEEEGYSNWYQPTEEPNDWGGIEDYAAFNWHQGVGVPLGTWNDEDEFEVIIQHAIVEFDVNPFQPLFVTVNNVAPTAAITGAPENVDEGTAIHFGSDVSDPGADDLTFDWNVYKDGELVQGGGDFEPGLDFTIPDEGTYVVTLTVKDGDGGVTTDTRTITANNVAPHDVFIDSAATGVRGQFLQFIAHSEDPGLDNHTSTIDYGDGTIETVPGGGNFAFGHVYATTGTFTVTYTVSDEDGGVGSTKTTATVKVFDLQVDPLDPSKQVLAVGGSTGADDIELTPGATAGTVLLTIDGVAQGSFAADRLLVFAQAGDDRVHVAGGVTQPATIFGGGGRDILVGGRGADRIIGNAGDDVLVAGYTAYDANQVFSANGFGYEQTALVWRRTDLSYAVRVAGLNGEAPLTHLVLKASGPGRTVFDDGAVDSLDTLQGSSGQDWFIVNGAGDRVTDQSGEVVTRT